MNCSRAQAGDARKVEPDDEIDCAVSQAAASPPELPAELWEGLLRDAERFAVQQIHEYTWRGSSSGVLPGGFDANSIAAQAIVEALRHREFLDPKAALEEANVSEGWESECRSWRKELHSGVRRVVNRLWHLKERVLMRNVDDLPNVLTDDGETLSALETIPHPDPNPHESLLQAEALADEAQFLDQFQTFLGEDRALQSLYACLRAGIFSRQTLARKLKISPQTLKNRLRRLQRRASSFSSLNGSDRTQKGSKYFRFFAVFGGMSG